MISCVHLGFWALLLISNISMMGKGIMRFHVHVWVEDLCGLKDFHGGKFFDSVHEWVLLRISIISRIFVVWKSMISPTRFFWKSYAISKNSWCFRFSKDFMNVREVELSFVKMWVFFWNFSHIREFSNSLEGWWFFVKVLQDTWFRIFIGGQFNFLMGCVLCGVFFVMTCAWDF